MAAPLPPLEPDLISAESLPLAVRGYRREETDHLLQRVARQYRQLLEERDTLATRVRELERVCDDLQADKSLLRAVRKQLEGELQARRPARHAAEVERLVRLRGQLRSNLRRALEAALQELAADEPTRPHLQDDLAKLLAAG